MSLCVLNCSATRDRADFSPASPSKARLSGPMTMRTSRYTAADSAPKTSSTARVSPSRRPDVAWWTSCRNTRPRLSAYSPYWKGPANASDTVRSTHTADLGFGRRCPDYLDSTAGHTGATPGYRFSHG